VAFLAAPLARVKLKELLSYSAASRSGLGRITLQKLRVLPYRAWRGGAPAQEAGMMGFPGTA
jgi:hypothetical protein